MRRSSLTAALVLAALAGMVLATAGIAMAQALEFKLGFKTMASLVPDVVGQPLENEHYGSNGDSLQQTTGGLLVWRKADNWTAFTDGSQTWVNGPEGLQQRPNNQRFNWERAAKVGATEVNAFTPGGIKGPDQEGYCWTESLASTQNNAWRCMVGNRIYDPCFDTPAGSGTIVCDASPLTSPYGFRLKLTQPLPERKDVTVTANRAWIVELADGVTCGFLTGASTGAGGERANYGCTDGWYILGDLKPGAVWTANEASITVTSQGPTLVDSATVNVKTVWR